jgi:hypothetical protein
MRPFRLFNLLLLLVAATATGYSQALECTTNVEPTPTVRTEGAAEATGDVWVVCTGGTPSASTPIDITLTLNANLTSRTFGTNPVKSEALLLIDEPQPDAVNTSNGFSYNGQVPGTPYAAAGSPHSGNVYQAEQSSATSVTWSGVPFVAPGPSGTRSLRMTNIRANATMLPVSFGLSPVVASLSATIPIANAGTILVGLGSASFVFAASVPEPGTANLTFTENFAYAFRIRIDPTTGPFTMARQDVPGVVYFSESQFTPCFTFGNCASPPAGPIGLASTGTMLLARISNLGTNAASVSVPNQVISEKAFTAAYLIVGGMAAGAAGSTSLPVSGGSVDVLYEVTENGGFNGCPCLDGFTIPGALLDSSGASLAYPANAVFKGNLAPIDSTATASPTAPRPRFVP